MTIDRPAATHQPQLKLLWQEAFGDSEEFVALFFRTGYDPARCRVLTEDGVVRSALYWFDCACRGEKVAYIYAVATAECARGRGLAKKLLEDTHRHLQSLGFAGCALCPAGEGLAAYYQALGYRTFCGRSRSRCQAGEPLKLSEVTSSQYARERSRLLPEGAVMQEGALLDYLAAFNGLYAGDGFVLAARREQELLYVAELLGECRSLPGIVAALDCREGSFPAAGAAPFAMYLPLNRAVEPPAYLGLDLS